MHAAVTLEDMAPPCKCCTHPDAASISVALLNGATYTGIAERFGMTRQAVARHVDSGHLGDAIAALELENATMATEAIVEGVMRLHARTLALLTAAEEERDGKQAAALIREARHSLETIATLQLHAPVKVQESDAPDIDQRIQQALDARLADRTDQEQSSAGAPQQQGNSMGFASNGQPGQADARAQAYQAPRSDAAQGNVEPVFTGPLAIEAGIVPMQDKPKRTRKAKAGTP